LRANGLKEVTGRV